MSKQNSFIANPLDNSSSDNNAIDNNQEQEKEEFSKNPLESDEEGNESAVLQHLIDNDQNHYFNSDEVSNPMIEQDPISLDNIVNQKFASIGQQYHVCQTILDCNKTIELQQGQIPQLSCDELFDPIQSNKEKSKDIIKNLESQLQSFQQENQILKKKIIEKKKNLEELTKIKDHEISKLLKENENLNDSNAQIQRELQNQQKEIQFLKYQIKIFHLKKQQIRNPKQEQKLQDMILRYQVLEVQELHKATSLNDQTIATLSVNQIEIRKIPTLSIDIPSAHLFLKPNQSKKIDYVIKLEFLMVIIKQLRNANLRDFVIHLKIKDPFKI